MAYKYIAWENGDTVTPERLNKIETTINSFETKHILLTGTMNNGQFILSMPYDDIKNAFINGASIVIDMEPYSNQYTYMKVLRMEDNYFAAGQSLFTFHRDNNNQAISGTPVS